MAARRVNRSVALTRERRVRGWTGRKYYLFWSVRCDRELNPRILVLVARAQPTAQLNRLNSNEMPPYHCEGGDVVHRQHFAFSNAKQSLLLRTYIACNQLSWEVWQTGRCLWLLIVTNIHLPFSWGEIGRNLGFTATKGVWACFLNA